MTSIAFYPGSFDPVTNGHLDIIQRAGNLADTLIIGAGVHHGKKPVFDVDERVAMLTHECLALARSGGCQFQIVTFENLAVDAAREHGANIIIRGLRDSGDFEYEMQMASMNADLAPDIETVFLASSPPVSHIAASLVRQIASMNGDVSPFVPKNVVKMLAKRS
ncbi:MAG: pantetheine-phosphate adenylyltransferase [bacterium]|nr:pantetheine-phosphate adenylyltransferase [bacterium]